MYIVTWNGESYCAVLHSKEEVFIKVTNLLEDGYLIDNITIYEVLGDSKKIKFELV